MQIAWLIPSILIPSISGFLLATIFLRDGYGVIERACYGFGLGMGMLGFFMFVSGYAGMPFNITVESSFLLILAFVSAAILYKSKPSAVTASARLDLNTTGVYIWIFFLAWTALRTGYVFHENLTRPLYSMDTWTNWSAGAKLFFYENGLPGPESEYHLGKGYRLFLGHPLNISLFQTWSSMWLGSFHEAYTKIWAPFYYIGLLGIFYYGVKRESNGLFAAIATFFLSSAPLITYHGTEAYADLPLSFYNLACVITLLNYIRTGNYRLLVLSGILAGAGVLTKNEGLFLIVITIIVLVLHNRGDKRAIIRALSAFLIPVLVFLGPWLAVKFYNNLGFGHSGVESKIEWLTDPTFAEGAERVIHWEVIGIFIKEFVFSSNFNLIIPFWIIITVLGFKQILRSDLKYLYFIILMLISIYLLIYLTIEVTAVTDFSGIHRNMLSFMPVIFLSSALLIARLLDTKSSIKVHRS